MAEAGTLQSTLSTENTVVANHEHSCSDQESTRTSSDDTRSEGGSSHGTTETTTYRSVDTTFGEDVSCKPGSGEGSRAEALVFPVACLQCELKKLPCDKTQPSCMRCLRMKDGPCLVQRRPMLQDLVDTEKLLRHVVVMRLESDDQEMWKRKKDLEEQVRDSFWRLKIDTLTKEQLLSERWMRKRFVLPATDSARGGSFILYRLRYERRGVEGGGEKLVVHWSPSSTKRVSSADEDERAE